MALLGTADALEVLAETSTLAGVDGRVQDRLALVQSLFTSELARIESDLAVLVTRGEVPATEAAKHLVGSGGKRIRPLTVLLSAACFGPVPDAATQLAVVAEIVHSATLLHDDVVDDASDRRGKISARMIWGNAVSVLSGDLLLAHALDRTFEASAACMPDLLRTFRRLVDGEVVQLRGRTSIDASESTYFRILEDKTASLFGWSARAGARAASAKDAEIEALGRFGERIGLAFQLVDDVLDYEGDPSVTGKTLLSDLAEGKMTLPLVLALRDTPSLRQDLDLARGGDSRAAARLGGQVRTSGACESVRRRAAEETARAVAELEGVPKNPARYVLAEVASELVRRTR